MTSEAMKSYRKEAGNGYPFSGSAAMSCVHLKPFFGSDSASGIRCNAAEETRADTGQHFPKSTIEINNNNNTWNSKNSSSSKEQSRIYVATAQGQTPPSTHSGTSEVTISSGSQPPKSLQTLQTKYYTGFPFKTSSGHVDTTEFDDNFTFCRRIQSLRMIDDVSNISGNFHPSFASGDALTVRSDGVDMHRELQLTESKSNGREDPSSPGLRSFCLPSLPSLSLANEKPRAASSYVSSVSTVNYKYLPAVPSPDPSSRTGSLPSASQPKESKRSNNIPKPIIKSSTKTSPPPTPVRKCVTFSGSDLVHVTDQHVTDHSSIQDTFVNDLFPRYEAPVTEVPEEQDDADHFGLDLLQENPGFWIESSTDAEPCFSSGGDAAAPTPPSLSFVNNVFGRTTILVTSGTFRPSDAGKLNGKTVEDLEGGRRDSRRTLSTGTLNGIQSHRTRVKVDFSQGVLDINHNPGQTVEVVSKATQDNPNAVSSYKAKDAPKSNGEKEFPNKTSIVKQKIFHKLSHYKWKLIMIACFTLTIVCLAIGLAVGLGR